MLCRVEASVSERKSAENATSCGPKPKTNAITKKYQNIFLAVSIKKLMKVNYLYYK